VTAASVHPSDNRLASLCCQDDPTGGRLDRRRRWAAPEPGLGRRAHVAGNGRVRGARVGRSRGAAGAFLERLAVSVLVLAGGGLYTLGARACVFRRPDPAPAVFGYHEVFHLLVIAAAVIQYIAVSFVVLGAA
jgi:hypothetical protein